MWPKIDRLIVLLERLVAAVEEIARKLPEPPR
jgi:hypothetical protein